MLPDDLIETANLLADSKPNKPKQANLRRAVSTTYYAMFHTLAKCCADLLVGTQVANRSNEAWTQVYRALEHRVAKNACGNNTTIKKFPTAIQDFADMFIQMQKKRHEADYNPNIKLYKSAVLIDIILVKSSIKKFKATPIKDRLAFSIFVLLKQRS